MYMYVYGTIAVVNWDIFNKIDKQKEVFNN